MKPFKEKGLNFMKDKYLYHQTYRDYYKKKNRIPKKILAFAIAGVLGVGGYALVKGAKSGNIKTYPTLPPYQTVTPITPVPTVETTATPVPTSTPVPTATPEPIISYDDGFNKGDSVITVSDVNMRLNATEKAFKLGVLPKDSIVNRILSDGDWDLVRYGDQIAYVHTDYTRENEVDYNNDYYHIEDYSDIVYTTSGLNFRLGPSTEEKKVFQMDKNEEAVVIGKVIPNDHPDDVWYLVRARGQIGFINAKYTKSLRSTLEASGVNMNEVKIQKFGYLKDDTTVLNQNGDAYTTLEKYQLAEVLQSNGKYSLILSDGVVGYVPSKSLHIYNGSFLTVDKSDKRVSFYFNNDMAYRGQCWVGRKSMPTEEGCFTPYAKGRSHTFPDGSQATRLWMPFNGGQALHDYKPGESHGCVRLTDEAADFIYEHVPQKTPVLVKK